MSIVKKNGKKIKKTRSSLKPKNFVPKHTRDKVKVAALERRQDYLAFGSDEGNHVLYSENHPVDDLEESMIDSSSSDEILDRSYEVEDSGEYSDFQEDRIDEDIILSSTESEEEHSLDRMRVLPKRYIYSNVGGEAGDNLLEETLGITNPRGKNPAASKRSSLFDPEVGAKFSWSSDSELKLGRTFQGLNAATEDISDLAFAQEFQGRIEELKQVLGPLINYRQMKVNAEGLDLLSAKYRLLGNYCALVLRYLQYKASQQPVSPNLKIELVRHRLLIEKLKPIELRLQHQIDSLLQAATGELTNLVDSLRPGMGTFEDSEEEKEREVPSSNEEGIYKAPKINPISFDEDEPKRDRKQGKRVSFNLESESEEPEEQSLSAYGNEAELIQDKTLKVLQERSSYEEENLLRFNLSKKEKTQLKLKQKLRDDLDDLESFMDDFEDKQRPGKNPPTLPVKNLSDEEISSDDIGEEEPLHINPSVNKELAKKKGKYQQKSSERNEKIKYRPNQNLPTGINAKSFLKNRNSGAVFRNRNQKNSQIKDGYKFGKAFKQFPTKHIASNKAQPKHYKSRTSFTRNVKF